MGLATPLITESGFGAVFNWVRGGDKVCFVNANIGWNCLKGYAHIANTIALSVQTTILPKGRVISQWSSGLMALTYLIALKSPIHCRIASASPRQDG